VANVPDAFTMAPFEPTLTDATQPETGRPSTTGSTFTYQASYGPSTVTLASAMSMPVAVSRSNASSRASAFEGRSAGGTIGSGSAQRVSGGQGGTVPQSASVAHGASGGGDGSAHLAPGGHSLDDGSEAHEAPSVAHSCGTVVAGSAEAEPVALTSHFVPDGSQLAVPPPDEIAPWLAENHHEPPLSS